jgi:hypothetical protein
MVSNLAISWRPFCDKIQIFDLLFSLVGFIWFAEFSVGMPLFLGVIFITGYGHSVFSLQMDK